MRDCRQRRVSVAAVASAGAFVALTGVLLLAIPAKADVTATVTLTGKPASQDETFFAKANGCGESPVRHTENWKVGPKGELGDVVVWVDDPKLKPPTGFSAPAQSLPEIELKQIGCRYVPHVAAVQAGVNFKITNGDPTLHNIRANASDGVDKPLGAVMFNFGQAVQGQTDEREFDNPGLYSLQCDVHSWMQCWIMVLKDGCFGVTDLEGKAGLRTGDQLADGDYKIEAWHPRFAVPLMQTIHVKNGTAHAEFQFDGTKSF